MTITLLSRPRRSRKITLVSPTQPSAATPQRAGGSVVMLTTLTGVFCVIGLAMVLSASSVQALRQQGSSWYYFNRQLLWLALGSTACFALSRIDYGVLRRLFGARLSSLALFASTFALFLTLVPSIGITIYGSSRWISLGFLTVQPSEFVKLSFIFFLADVIDRRYHVREDVVTILKPSLLWLGVLSVIVALQPDLSATITLGAIVLTMWAIANVPWRYLLGLGGVGALLFAASIALNPYQRERFLSFTDPLANSQGGGYQALQSMIGFSDGGIFGVGIGGSRAKWGFLPQAHTDFVYSVIGEELGLLGALAVLAMFVLLGVLGVRIALRARDNFGTLLAAGITAWIMLEATLNIAAAVGLMPVTGTALPFLSSGGSNLFVVLCAIGILLSIARHADTKPKVSRRTGSTRRPRVNA